MSEGCPDCGCPLEVCCGQNRKKYVPVSELKREIEYLINWGKFQQATNEIYRHTTDSLNDLWIEKLEKSLKELGLSEKKKETFTVKCVRCGRTGLTEPYCQSCKKELGLSSVSDSVHGAMLENTEKLIKKHNGNEKKALKEFLSEKSVVRVRFGRGSYPTELEVKGK